MQQIRTLQDGMLIERRPHIGRDCRVAGTASKSAAGVRRACRNSTRQDCRTKQRANPYWTFRIEWTHGHVLRLSSRKKYGSGELTQRGPPDYNFEIRFGNVADRPHSERIVPKAREHHAVVCDRSAADAAEGFALGVRVLQADLVPPERTPKRPAPETGGSLLHDPSVAHARSGGPFEVAPRVDVEWISISVASHGTVGRGQKVSLSAFLFLACISVNIQFGRGMHDQAGQRLDFADRLDGSGCVECHIGELSRTVTADALAAHAG